jgi:hypothetical protein
MVWTLKTKLLATLLAVSLAGGMLWAWSAAVERQARELALAEEHEKQAVALKEANDAHDRQLANEREQTAKLIEANQALADRLSQSVAQRNQDATAIRAALLAPKTPEQVVKDAQANLGITPSVQDGSFRLTQEQFQALIEVKVDRDRLVLNNADLDRQVRLAQDTITRLQSASAGLESSAREKDAIIAAQGQTIADYKRIAKRSKWRRFGSAIGRVSVAVLPAVAVAVILR